MNNEEKYNGWTNFATWKANLELVDEESWAGTAWINIYSLEGAIREAAADYAWADIDPNSFAANALQLFFDQVNWLEIAEEIAESMELDIMDKEED